MLQPKRLGAQAPLTNYLYLLDQLWHRRKSSWHLGTGGFACPLPWDSWVLISDFYSHILTVCCLPSYAYAFKEIPDDSRKGESLVFLLARPPKTAASFGWSSEDVYELCHWAVLVLNDTVNLGMLKDIIVGLKGGLIRNPSEIQLGFVVEIGRSVSSSPSVLVAKAFQPFTVADLMQHFPNCSMAFVGITTENEASIKARGEQASLLRLTRC